MQRLLIKRSDDETGRLLSYLISIYEIFFGFILAGGIMQDNAVVASSLMRASLSFFLAAIGLHFFVNTENIQESEYRKKRGKLWIGVIALLLGILCASSIGPDAFTNHIFFLLYILYVIFVFIYIGVLRNVFFLGACTYGFIRLTGVLAGSAIAGKVVLSDFEDGLTYVLASYVMFHVICEFMRWTAVKRGTRFSILLGFMLIVGLLTYQFYHYSAELADIKSKLIIMTLVLILLVLVGFPPLYAIRSMKAKPLLSIFPKGLAGGVILSMIFFVVLRNDLRLLLFILLAAAILAFYYGSVSKESRNNEI